MKYILLFILLFWISRRILRIFTVVSNDGGDQNISPPEENKASNYEQNKGEYIDYEEIED
ncbi:MAG: hypothetical protein JXR19_05630 [Bacteroidia bacterium]